jgi:RPA family protein
MGTVGGVVEEKRVESDDHIGRLRVNDPVSDRLPAGRLA